MNAAVLSERIVSDPAILSGQPVIHGTRLSVEYILGLLGNGATFEEIEEEYPDITEEDIRACLLYASHALHGTELLDLKAGPS